jgi:hypothetical protein
MENLIGSRLELCNIINPTTLTKIETETETENPSKPIEANHT